MDFHLVWYAFIFPNTGFTIAVIDIGEQLSSQRIQWVGSIMSILLVGTWLFVIVMHIRAVWKKDIMMPGKDEVCTSVTRGQPLTFSRTKMSEDQQDDDQATTICRFRLQVLEEFFLGTPVQHTPRQQARL